MMVNVLRTVVASSSPRGTPRARNLVQRVLRLIRLGGGIRRGNFREWGLSTRLGGGAIGPRARLTSRTSRHRLAGSIVFASRA